MKLQDGPAGCGATALLNALQALGFYGIPQEAISALAGTDYSGTSPRDIKKAAKLLNARATPITTTNPDAALCMLRGALLSGSPMLLCVDKEDHWVTAVGMLGDRFCVADPADGDVVDVVDAETLLKRWLGKGKGALFYALRIQKEE